MEKIIIDTDLGFDCDDAGALALANILQNENALKIAAVVHSVNRDIGGEAIKIVNAYYGNTFPVGVAERYAIDVDDFFNEFYGKFRVAEGFRWDNEKPTFGRILRESGVTTHEKFPSATQVICDVLQKSDDKSITFVCIGQANNVAQILSDNSETECGLSMRELFLKKVSKIVVMCGNFLQRQEENLLGGLYWKGEFNVLLDIPSMRQLFSEDLPIFVLDFNEGCDVLSGSGFVEQTDNPVTKMYLSHGRGRTFDLPSWDILAMMFASGQFENMFSLSECGKVEITDSGRSVFHEGKGPHRLIRKNAAPKDFSEVINEVFRTKRLR